MGSSGRNVYLDFMKGLTAVLMVLGHCIQFGQGLSYMQQEQFFDNIVFRTIYSFHMPAFMLISGYLFFNTVHKYSPFSVIRKKLKTTFVPILVFGSVDFIIKLCTVSFNGSAMGLAKAYVFSLIGALWFLWAMFFCSMIMLAVHWIFRDKLIWCIIITALIVAFMPDILNLKMAKFVFPFFSLGYYWNACSLNKQICKVEESKKKIISALCFVCVAMLFCIGVFYYVKDVSIYRNATYILGAENIVKCACGILFRFCMGICGCTLYFSLGKILCDKCSKTILSMVTSIGKCSLGIYIYNVYMNYALIGILDSVLPNGLIVLGETIVVAATCWGITLVTQKNKWLRLVLYGGA